MKTLQTYNGNDLGAVYSKQSTQFRLWAPTAERVRICFYATGDGGEAAEIKDIRGQRLFLQWEVVCKKVVYMGYI